jgi:hypothetical protein
MVKKLTAFLSKSPNPKKKYRVIINDGIKNKTLDFGQAGAGDFLIHNNLQEKNNYIKRHSKMNENFNDPFTRSFWSRWFSWEKPNIRDAVDNIEKKFNMKIFY